MAEFLENIATIRRAIYGKEMRPAIYEALLQDWEAVNTMTTAVDTLNSRIDSLPNNGGTPGQGGSGTLPGNAVPPTILVYSAETVLEDVGVMTY